MTYQRPDDSGIGEVIDQRYALVRQIREEPWGEVWLAQDRLLETEVGFKLLAREAPEWAAAQKIFEQEAIRALRLRHPLILGVFYLGKTDTVLYLVQEPFPGETLLARLTRKHRFTLPQALQLLEQTAQALALAHQQGIAHRSLSPLHILLEGEEIRLANFAFPPADGDQAMHLELKAYDPPEVIHGDPPTAAGNVFSLGVLGFRLVAGSLPYPLTFDEPFPYRLETLPVDLEEIPLPLQNFLLQCLAVDPEERFADAGAFLAQLRQVREQMRPGRQLFPPWEEERPPRVRQAAAQAVALLGKLREAGKPLGQKAGAGAQASWQTLKAAPRRLWWGLGLAVLIIAVAMGGLKTVRRAATSPPPAPATVAAPVQLPAAGGGPPLVESEAPRAPASAAKLDVGPAPPAAATAAPPEAKAAGQERYLLLVATYAGQKQAQALLTRLKARNYRARILRRTSAGKTLYQVQVGPITGAKAAEDAARNIKEQEKITPKVVKMTASTTTKKTGASLSRRPAR
ncbi:MAG: protein kinase [Pseudomonadota bacterium]